MEETDKDCMMIRMVGGQVFALVLAHPASPGQRAVKRLLLLFFANQAQVVSYLNNLLAQHSDQSTPIDFMHANLVIQRQVSD